MLINAGNTPPPMTFQPERITREDGTGANPRQSRVGSKRSSVVSGRVLVAVRRDSRRYNCYHACAFRDGLKPVTCWLAAALSADRASSAAACLAPLTRLPELVSCRARAGAAVVVMRKSG